MSSLLDVVGELNLQEKICKSNHNNCSQVSILKSKENIFKHKCSKALKNKLKKYKLRRDGQEDPDILDVSRILVSSLKIKSPNSQQITKLNHIIKKPEESKPRNYLFKMVRRKKPCLKSDLKIKSDNKLTSFGCNDELLPIISDIENHDTRQMDAFKLMMDSRNKSIGRNSPGKDKCLQESELQDIVSKKELKAKRILCLEKLAEKKGLSEKKKIEELREECVKKKMLKRAERLKNMITADNSKCNKKHNAKKPLVECITGESNDNDVVQDKNCPTKQNGNVKLFDFISEPKTIINKSQEIIKTSKEDDEFLNKLSPSIRKKENMLSYFKKLPKDAELSDEEKSCESIIKVKFTPKRKRKIKSLNISKDGSKVLDNNECDSSFTNLIKSGQKRKRELNNESDKTASVEEKVENISDNNNVRPKRNVKKPSKYSEDIEITSSDEELHIFTPKKKRNLDKKGELLSLVKDKKQSNNGISVNVDNIQEKKCGKVENELNTKHTSVNKVSTNKKNINKLAFTKKLSQNKATKLAPIFVTRSQPSPVELEAKQIFLKSGVPDKLKIKSHQNNTNLSTDMFHTVVHVQQLSTDISVVSEKKWLQYSELELCQNYDNTSDLCLFKKLLVHAHASKRNTIYSEHKPDKILKSLKSAYPKFPVYRTYHLLKTKSQGELPDCNYSILDSSIEIINGMTDLSNENPEKLNWNDKYKPTSSNQIIGNFASVKELKRWLESWTENLMQNKNNYNEESDLSDFCFSDNDDSKDMFKHRNNILIITGQVGTGKTSSIYAVAAELAIKVIEVNASSKRTGKIMLQDLQEATQSHKVNRSVNKIDNSQKTQEEIITCKNKKRGKPKKTYERFSKRQIENYEKETPKHSQPYQNSQENSRTAMSLILIDDADIVFDQDDGFCSAVSQLIQSSKRPVILVTTSLSCPHLQKFLLCGKIIYMNPLLPRMLGTWLDIMCLADTSLCYPGLGMKLLDYYSGDIRKTINFLQYFVTSDKYLRQVEEQTLSQVTNTCNANIDDENSSMSWVDTDVVDSNFVNETFDANEAKQIIDQQLSSQEDISKKLFDVWWSIKGIMDGPAIKECSNTDQKILKSGVVQILNNISLIDIASIHKSNIELDIFSGPWHCTEIASVIEIENFDYYNKCNDVTRDISRELLARSMSIPRHIKCSANVNVHAPSMSLMRQRNKLVSRHNTLTSHLNPSAVLDRRALALDYWPFCRTICRLEKNKTESNIKRNNRFCHYLKSVNILCKNEYFDSLSESLS